MSTIMYGKPLAERIIQQISRKASQLPRRPVLAGIIVGEDPSSQVYFRSKEKDCIQCGIESRKIILPGDIPEQELIGLIKTLNADTNIDGILIQFPLPHHINERNVFSSLDPAKDVDGISPSNMGRIGICSDIPLPCTPAAVIALMEEYGIDAAGKNCVVIGRSRIVGKPAALLLLEKDATVTICHSKTAELSEITRKADIIICAAGRTGLLTADMIKQGAVIIDVSINRRADNGKLCGDALFEECADKAGFITPVPGGIGPVTRAVLMRNVLIAAERNIAAMNKIIE